MVCRGCGKALEDGEFRMVSEWPFCEACFDNLLKGKLGEAAPARPSTADSVPESSRRVETPRCHLCGRELGPAEGKKVGIWNFCSGCMQDLSTPSTFSEAEPSDREGEAGAGMPSGEEEGGEVSPLARMRIELVARVACNRCGRRIPLGGGRMVDGKPFCPECFHALTQESGEQAGNARPEEKEHPPAEASAECPLIGAEEELHCQSCEMPGPRSAFVEAEGFRICKACLGADRELAVRIARSRHLKMLQRLKEELL